MTLCSYRNRKTKSVESDETPKNSYCSEIECLPLLRDCIAKYCAWMLRRKYILYESKEAILRPTPPLNETPIKLEESRN